jgi:hypothetical protein
VTTDGGAPREGGSSGTRDNGLRCASYVAVADLDPRMIGGLLTDLRENGIAAYATPTPAAAGGYMELRLPDRPVDRLYVDEALVERARAIVEAETAQHRDTESIDFEAAWQQVLTSLQSLPPSEDVDAAPTSEASSYVVRPATLDDAEPYDPADDAHYEPPPAPPLPKLRSVTVAALASIAIGLALLVLSPDGGSLVFLAIVAIAGGIVSLVWNMRSGPPTDSGWDDGAVV